MFQREETRQKGESATGMREWIQESGDEIHRARVPYRVLIVVHIIKGPGRVIKRL